jgi:hypothetical protein
MMEAEMAQGGLPEELREKLGRVGKMPRERYEVPVSWAQEVGWWVKEGYTGNSHKGGAGQGQRVSFDHKRGSCA